MNQTEIATIVFEEGWNRQDFSRVRGLLAEEFPLHIGGGTRITNADALERIVGTWHTAFPDFRFEVHSITADEDLAAVRATLHGTHEGQWGELQATGRTVAVEHAFFLRFEDGLVVEVWEVLDRSAFHAQLTGNKAT